MRRGSAQTRAILQLRGRAQCGLDAFSVRECPQVSSWRDRSTRVRNTPGRTRRKRSSLFKPALYVGILLPKRFQPEILHLDQAGDQRDVRQGQRIAAQPSLFAQRRVHALQRLLDPPLFARCGYDPGMNAPSAPGSSPISFGLAGRVCIVTGGAQGIGEACARRFAREGAPVVIADLNDERGQALAAELGGLYVHCDVGDKVQVDALVARTVLEYGRIDVLVNNAGIFKAADFLDISEADFDAVLRVNLKGAFLVGQAVAREMAKANSDGAAGDCGLRGEASEDRASRGAIVNMSSVNGVLTIPTIASYNVSKGGINQLTRVMALALADKRIRVNAVAPGTIATELAAQSVLTSEEARSRILSRTPMKRLGQPAEIADTVAYLASDAASYITGEIVVVDGGRMTLNYTVPI
jgi:NAD(P)-dependent dehydrogenase (short-subunit alcohol dehydrogenase family)